MKLHSIAFLLLVVGGLNWLLFVFGFDIGTWISASWWMTVMKIVYVLVGLSAVYEVVTHKNQCKECMSGGGMSSGNQSMPKM